MIKCKIYTGKAVEEANGDIRFTKEQVGGKQIYDGGYFDYYDEKEFKLKIKKYAHLLGFSVDAYNENGKVFWSNYRDAEVKEDETSEIDKLRKEYLELSGEEADKRWKETKLSNEINKLKQEKE